MRMTVIRAAQIIIISLIAFFPLASMAVSNQTKFISDAEVKKIVAGLGDAIKQRDFSKLIKNVPVGHQLLWDKCGVVDAGDLQYPVGTVVDKLMSMTKDANIVVHQAVDTYLWNSADEVAIAHIQTEGWNAESPYIVFLFKFMNKTKKWEWTGVCHDILPPGKPSEGIYQPIYKERPILPRKGPRVFSDSNHLRLRIEEILTFRAFDALKPYAINSMLYFNECSSKMMENLQMDGEKVSVNSIVDFLKRNDQAKSAIVMVGNKKMYLDTRGWSGTYPNVSFWFAHGSDGWQLSGVSYCKQTLFDMMYKKVK